MKKRNHKGKPKLPATYLTDKPQEPTCFKGIPIEYEDRPVGASSRILCPETVRMPIVPAPRDGVPGVTHPLSHDARLTEQAAVKPPEVPKPHREEILGKLAEILTGRRSNHGAPEDNFGKIAEAWMLWFKWKLRPVYIAPEDVTVMMTLFKLAREAGGHAEDNCVDGAGYLIITSELHSKKAKA